jgi:hypothetical protein
VRVRGSRTVLLGKSSRSLQPVRNIVTIPTVVSAIVGSNFTRRFCYRFTEEMLRYRFVTSLILCTLGESFTTEFAHRLLKQADIVVWLFPYPDQKETMLTLRDHGVRNVLVTPIDNVFLSPDYLMDWTAVYRRALGVWKAEGIRHVVLPGPSNPRFQSVSDNFIRLLKDFGMTFTLTAPTPLGWRTKAQALLKRRVRIGCAVLEHDLTTQFCAREPEIVAQLAARCRVLFGRGVVLAPYFFARPCRADVIGFSGEVVALKIARDIGRRRPRTAESEPTHLYPLWMPQVNLGDVFV